MLKHVWTGCQMLCAHNTDLASHDTGIKHGLVVQYTAATEVKRNGSVSAGLGVKWKIHKFESAGFLGATGHQVGPQGTICHHGQLLPTISSQAMDKTEKAVRLQGHCKNHNSRQGTRCTEHCVPHNAN